MFATDIRYSVLVAVLLALQLNSPSRPESSPEPTLPVINYDACPGKDRVVTGVKIGYDLPMYSSWDGRAAVGTLRAGKVTVLSGVEVIRKPDEAIVKHPVWGSTAKVGDTVFMYAGHADGTYDFWGNGSWFKEDDENVAVGDSCGFADKNQCEIEIVKRGSRDWWLQVKTDGGRVAWVLAHRIEGDNEWDSGIAEVCED